MTAPDRIKVYVIDYGRKFLVMQWTDPQTGKRITRSTKTAKRREAAIVAADQEKRLNETRATGDGSIRYQSFLDLYQTQELTGRDEVTERWHLSKLTIFGERMQPQTLADITAICLAQYVAKMRGESYSEETIKGHMVAIRCALQWALAQGYISTIPAIPAARVVKGRKAKGRDLTFWEFVVMLRAVPKVVGKSQVESWRHLLIGLWISGLRIAEACTLSWDDPTAPRINLDGEFPLLEIDAEDDKGRVHRLLPITPDFGRFLLRTPKAQRKGLVFRPLGAFNQPVESQNWIGCIISQIGEAAGIIVDHRRNKFASAHDLRRTFGTRWAKRMNSFDLKELMRHKSIETTESYYIGQNAQAIAATLWKSSRHTTPNTTLGKKKL